MTTRSVSLLVHGGSKVGKTYFADTAPAPRVVLDAEGGNRFTASRKVHWDPIAGPPPQDDGTWDTCIVLVRDYRTMQTTYQWLNLGQHPFRSLTVDSISEVQQRCIDAIAGANALQQQDWGELLRSMAALVRSLRDLTMHPTKPLEVVTLIAMTRERAGKYKPYVQGQLETALPYYIDCILYEYVQNAEDGTPVRRMLTSPTAQFEAGDRTGRLPQVIDNPTIPALLEYIFGGATQ